MKRPNIVLLTVDCLRADRVGYYGYEKDTTPTIDTLAADGYQWEQCYSTGPRTNESFPGIISSALSADCGYVSEKWHRTPPSPTIASWLSDAGYHTSARLANPQLAELKGYSYGFDSFKNLAVGNVGWGIDGTEGQDESSDKSSILSKLGSKIHNLRLSIRNSNGITRWSVYAPLFYAYREYQRLTGWPTVDGADVSEELIETFPSDSPDQPWFRWAHFNDIHAPIHPGRVDRSDFDSISKISHYKSDIKRISQQETPTYDQLYDSMVRYVDMQIEKIISHLKQIEEWEETIVIIVSDHGEALYDRGVYGHASGLDRGLYDETRDYMYNELLHVPLIVGGGAVTESKTIPEATSTAWIHEIISEMADIEPGDFVRASGRESHVSPDSEAVVLADTLTDQGHTFAIVSGRNKVITRYLHPNDTSLFENSLCFDLQVDPKERNPEYGENPLDEFEGLIERDLITVGGLKNTSPDAEISEDTKELLSQLGYAE